MNLHFTKMHGAGNDYIYINCFEKEVTSPNALSILLSNRHYGIGGDGIVLICKSTIADAKMRMFNMDGSEGRMCGNAIRCVGKYLYDNRLVDKLELTIETLSGIKKLSLCTDHNLVSSVRVNMGKAELFPGNIPVQLEGDKIINQTVIIDDTDYAITCVSMGNPHAVIFQDGIDTITLSNLGPLFENSPIFPESINTEFVEIIDSKTLKMRVWERGSGETLACGTGACASVVAAIENGFCSKETDIKVILRGGELTIQCTEDAVYMTGNCIKVFEGTIDLGQFIYYGGQNEN